ncbi:MAG: hypothetical protein V1678_02495 [Candidatus Aenigmatarchaeota archaeon]
MISWQGYARESLPTIMRQSLEFCNVARSDFLLTRGMFWMVCNGRSYYAEFDVNGIDVKSNGWSFLSQDVLGELVSNNCNFLSSNNSKLMFYCGAGTLRMYNFDSNAFNMSKVGEINFSKQYFNCSYYSSSLVNRAVVSNLRCGLENY